VGFRVRRGRVVLALGAAGMTAAAGIGLAGPAGAASSAPQISGNWAGYVASGSHITAVTGTWKVPPAGALPPGVSSTWVGIGGFSSSDLIQAGTQQTSSPLDQVFAGGAYSAWYELLPASPVYLTGCSGDANCTVGAGDVMNVSVKNQGGNSWLISVADATRGWSFSKTFDNYASSESSAEWIHEAPSAAGVLPVPVGNSGTVTFDGASNTAVINGATEGLAASGAFPVEALPVETTTSALDPSGDGFNVCTYSLSCAPPTT
jgi:hypothetical protein